MRLIAYTILAVLFALAPIAEPAENVTAEWDYAFEDGVVIGFEIDLRKFRPVSEAWAPVGVSFVTWYKLSPLADGVYQARVRAFNMDGLRSLNSKAVTFAVPYAAPAPAPTHVRITVINRDGRTVNVMTDPLTVRAFYRMAPSGPPRVQKSTDLTNWQQFGEGCPPGEYRIETTLITITE